MNHSFDLKVAMDFDVDTAIFLNHMAFWLQKNAANGRHIYDGNVWTYNTLDAFSEIFPYWSKRQIGRVIKNCIDYGLIKKGNFNKKGYDQTLWYSFTDLAYKYYKQINVLIEKPSEAAETLILPNSNIHITEPSHQYQLQYQLQKKDLKTLVDSSNTTRVKTYSEDERFMAFYSCYPRKEKPRDAWKAFKALKPDDQLLKKIIQDVTRRKETHVTWQNGKQYISLPATYLRSAEYEGDITTQHVTDKEQPTPTFDYGHRVVVIDGIEYLESSKNG